MTRLKAWAERVTREALAHVHFDGPDDYREAKALTRAVLERELRLLIYDIDVDHYGVEAHMNSEDDE